MAEVGEDGKGMIVALGATIRQTREARGWSLRDLADATGLQPGLIELIEGEFASPRVVTLIAIARALDTTPAALLAQAEDLGAT